MNAARVSPWLRIGGTVSEVAPTHYRVRGLSRFLTLGDCIGTGTDGEEQLGEVIRISETGATVKPFGTRVDAGLGARAWRVGKLALGVHETWQGRVLDALGRPIDDGGPLVQGPPREPASARPPRPMRRQRIACPVATGVRAIDLFTPLCAGQRIGIFAGSGIGKSTLLAMLARSGGFDTVVVALVGERGREAKDFLQDALGRKELARTVAVVASGDESPMMRKLAPLTAMTVAEYFRDRGRSVLLIVDSVTRFAHAAREVALAAGEPPVARGYTPGVFSDIPKLLERAGPGEDGTGSITGIFSVLVDGDDHNDPVADCIRGTVDGHVVLSRAIAEQGRYPAIDVLASVSRLANQVWSADQRTLVLGLRAFISRFEETRDLRLMGGYQRGSDAELDQAVAMAPKVYRHLAQTLDEPAAADPFAELAKVLAQ